MKTPCILVLDRDFLSKRAIVSLMTEGGDVDVVVSEAADVQGLFEDISEINPDVVLMGESMSVAGKDSLSHLLMGYPNLKVIVVSEDSNWLYIFRREDKLMTQLDDLLTTIKTV